MADDKRFVGNVLNFPGGISIKGHGGGGGPTVDTETQRYVDAKTEATRAENSASFAGLSAKLDNIPTKGSLWTFYVATIGTGIAILALAQVWFGSGMNAASSNENIRDLIQANAEQIQETNRSINDLAQNIQENTDESEKKPE